jgi:AcrR family transcriptional regulator
MASRSISPVRKAGAHAARPTAPRTQAQRRLASEQRLAEAALQVLARKGWVGMTLAEVGEAAGVSRGLASHHFGNKAGLLRAITLQIARNFDEAMQASPATKPGLDAVLNYVSVYLGRKDRKWTSTRTLLLLMAEALVEGSENAPVLAGYMKRMFDYLEENIRIGIEAGEIHPDISPKLGAETVIGTLRGVMLQRLIASGRPDMSDMHEHLQHMFRRAFAVGRGGRSRSTGGEA